MRWRVLFLLPILFFSGCEFPWTDESPSVQHKLDWCATPGKTLASLAWVWTTNREIENYSALLTEDYRFYFAPINIDPPPQTGYKIPQYWTYMEDVSATGNMFAQAYNIRLEVLNAGDFDNPSISGDLYVADNVLIQFFLWPDNADFYYMATGPCDFEFTKVDGNWLISAWYDRSGGSQSTGALREQYLD